MTGTLKNISHKEKLMIIAAAVFIAAVFAWVGVYEPAVERMETMRSKIESKKNELVEVMALAERHRKAEARFIALDARLARQGEDYSPLSVMESMAATAGLKENVVSMSPAPPVEMEGYRESSVDLKLEKTTLPALVDFLKAVRAAPGYMRVKRMTVKPEYENPERLEVAMSVAGYEKIK